ncbi:MAG: phosphatidate cytidylyltransferase [Burkholderiaceae bacterium]|jgi:CDP-diglyceride synthetase|nr:phosphatidate cytidylyltransferase [Burkholderiaceae bacterium]
MDIFRHQLVENFSLSLLKFHQHHNAIQYRVQNEKKKMLPLKLGKYSYRALMVLATVLALAGPASVVAGIFIFVALAGVIELLAQLQLSRATRNALLVANAALVVIACRGLVPTEPTMLLMFAINAVFLSVGLKVDKEDRFNAILLIGASSLAIIGVVILEACHLLMTPTAHISRLQECIVLVAAQDFCASAGGKLWPRGRLASRISPNKTLSGAAFGIVGGFGAWFFLRVVVGSNLSATQALVILIAGIFGDLLFSSIKRVLLVKDFGDTLGAKGGVLDRIDSTILAVLVAYALPS